jgi:uncharacterized phiE125 gp8 family phage protein
MSAVAVEAGGLPLGLAEVRDWLRLGPGDGDAAAVGLIRAAGAMCEAFTGQMLLIRSVTEERDAAPGWMTLLRCPLVAVDSVAALAADGVAAPLPAGGWEVRRDAAALRLTGALPARLRIGYRAGIASEPGQLPEALRHGLLRLVQHLHYDAPGEGGAAAVPVPAIVAALWAPWRRIGLGARP